MKKSINDITVDLRTFDMYQGNKDFQGCMILHKRFGRAEKAEIIEFTSGEQLRDLYYMLGRAIDELDRAK